MDTSETSAEGLASTNKKVANGGRREGVGAKRRAIASVSKYNTSSICPDSGAHYVKISDPRLSYIHTKAVSVERLANQKLHFGKDEVSDWLDAQRLGVNSAEEMWEKGNEN
ncbi:hypothetical protein TNCV_1588241 [Trichonephila clavipes]|uniref:Uncharacterized protein n=1 Tax=Trichonephila clavipes TaxID=2585209 RepID=A0A8X6V3E6_TRICX|nr:hypothetical protein TNCV_1588241 [Trichonephila clavipes]